MQRVLISAGCLKLKNQERMWLDTQTLRNEVGIRTGLTGIDAWKYDEYGNSLRW